MTRGLREDDRRSGRGGDVSFSSDDERSDGRSGRVVGDDGLLARFGRRGDDPCGRRSLTGLEVRRQRST
jgi:hypothetical protein